MTDCNRLRISGFIRQREALRFTPGGIAMTRCVLEHVSEQREADSTVTVNCELRMQAAGVLAQQVQQWQDSLPITVEGFVSREAKNRSGIVLHITAIEY